jgi:uncharacterized repeat protein (TIGR01451 family)
MNYRVTSWLVGLLLLAGSFNAFAQTASIRVVQTVSPESASPGSTVTYQIQIINTGPDDAGTVQIQDILPPQLAFVSLSQTQGPAANCTTPAAGGSGSIDCNLATVTANSMLEFQWVAQVSGGATPGEFISNTFSVPSGSTDDEHNSATSNLYILQAPLADVGVTMTGPVSGAPGTDVTYQVHLMNAGPDAASGVQLSLSDLGGNNTLTFINLQQTSGPALSCSTPQAGASGDILCTIGSLAPDAVASLSIRYQIPANTTSGTFIASQAIVSSNTAESNSENNAHVSGFITALSDIAVSLIAPTNVRYNSDYTTNITISNNGPDTAANASWHYTLPGGTTFVSFSQNGTPAAVCSTPPVGASGQIQCMWSSLLNQTQMQFTLVLHAMSSSNLNSVLQGTSDSDDNLPDNNRTQSLSAMTDVPLLAIPTLSEWAMLLLASLMTLGAIRSSLFSARWRLRQVQSTAFPEITGSVS